MKVSLSMAVRNYWAHLLTRMRSLKITDIIVFLFSTVISSDGSLSFASWLIFSIFKSSNFKKISKNSFFSVVPSKKEASIQLLRLRSSLSGWKLQNIYRNEKCPISSVITPNPLKLAMKKCKLFHILIARKESKQWSMIPSSNIKSFFNLSLIGLNKYRTYFFSPLTAISVIFFIISVKSNSIFPTDRIEYRSLQKWCSS